MYGRINTDEWHQRVEREFRGKRTFESYDHAHMCVKLVFSFFELGTSPQYMTAGDLLMAYEALNLLMPMARRDEESMFRQGIQQCRYAMIDRLNGQIPVEMGRFMLSRDGDSWDRLATVGDHLSWETPSTSKISLFR